MSLDDDAARLNARVQPDPNPTEELVSFAQELRDALHRRGVRPRPLYRLTATSASSRTGYASRAGHLGSVWAFREHLGAYDTSSLVVHYLLDEPLTLFTSRVTDPTEPDPSDGFTPPAGSVMVTGLPRWGSTHLTGPVREGAVRYLAALDRGEPHDWIAEP